MHSSRHWLLSLWIVGLTLLVASAPAVAAEESEASRRERLEKMSAEEKEMLAEKKERFDSLPKDEQQHLRDLHQSVAASSEVDDLTGVMTRYHAWLKNLPAEVRRDVLALPADKRVEKIKSVLREQESQRFRQLAGQLPQADIDAIFAWLESFIELNQERLLERVHRRRWSPGADEAAAAQAKKGAVGPMPHGVLQPCAQHL